ncbi:MAG: hypothetical protein LBT33_05890, partial [Spirochaetia bacterium]|nr:hypothetical protein [Spirochaetia bacterium]
LVITDTLSRAVAGACKIATVRDAWASSDFALQNRDQPPARQSRKLRGFAGLRPIAATREIAGGQQTEPAIAGNRPAFRHEVV